VIKLILREKEKKFSPMGRWRKEKNNFMVAGWLMMK
jgi:hypothetical protein